MSITCQICHEKIHSVQLHLKKSHEDVTLEDYQAQFPIAPLFSPSAEAVMARKRSEAGVVQATVAATTEAEPEGYTVALMHEVFGFGKAAAALNARGEPIKIKVFTPTSPDLVPDKDPAYIFDINLVKTILMGLEMNLPIYLWGHSGVGKTTCLEQVCAHTGREFIRVQHTANTEEADIEGGWLARGGETVFNDGPLPECMSGGYVYCADEYDFASPMVSSVYQAVLEGKPLRIKSAGKLVRPHPNFRMVATGNTNGSGDESGLYAGTQIQNAANYERFAIVSKVEYMPEAQEIGILVGKTGIDKAFAEKMVKFANMIRASYEKREVAVPISPRALINATRLGMGRDNYKFGIEQAYINRLPPASAHVAENVFQRMFG